MKLPCELIHDLLPLYAEHLTSPETNQLLEEHLQSCPACQEELRVIQLPVPVQPDAAADAPLKTIRNTLRRKRILTVLAVLLCTLAAAFLGRWMYMAQAPVTVEDAKIWTYNRKENGANLCILEVQGEGVRLTLDGTFSWGEPNITVRAVRYRFPGFHAAFESVFGSAASSQSITVSNTQLLTVECANSTLYYQEGQPVYPYRVNGRILYGTEQQFSLYPRA